MSIDLDANLPVGVRGLSAHVMEPAKCWGDNCRRDPVTDVGLCDICIEEITGRVFVGRLHG